MFCRTLVLLAVPLMCACISSRHKTVMNCAGDLRSSIVLMPEIYSLSSNQSEILYKVVQREMALKDVRILYFPHEEWNLAAEGIVASDTAFLRKLHARRIPFLIVLNIENTYSGPWLDYLTPLEVNSRWDTNASQYLPPANPPAEKKVWLKFRLIETNSGRVAYESTTQTSINPIAFRNDSNAELSVNVGSTNLALQKAVRKGTQNLLKGCLSHSIR